MTRPFCQLLFGGQPRQVAPPLRIPFGETARVEPSDLHSITMATLSKSLNGPGTGPPGAGASRRAVVRRAVLAVISLTGVWLVAHEGHDETIRPVYKEVQVGGALYRAGFAVIPQDPVVGEDARLEFRILHAATPEGGVPLERPATLDNTRVEIVPTDGEVIVAARIVPGDKPGTYLVRHRFADGGQYGISTRVQSGSDTVSVEFPILVRAGPVARAPIIIDAVLLLIFGAAAFSVWRLRREPEKGSPTAGVAAIVAAGLVILVGAHVWAAPRIGRLFLPERHGGIVAWDDATKAAPVPEAAPHVDPPGTPPHTHPPAPPRGRGGATPQPPSGQAPA